MTPKQKDRLVIVIAIIVGVAIAAGLGLMAFKENIRFFVSPEDVQNTVIDINGQYRIAGIVKPGSVEKQPDNISVKFILTDCKAEVAVFFTGILPDLFREGQTIVANGKFDSDKNMQAEQVLAKHDENYVPSEASESIMQAQANQCANDLSPSSEANTSTELKSNPNKTLRY
jgi:cytochrome c-type biogenesis protein CcmE